MPRSVQRVTVGGGGGGGGGVESKFSVQLRLKLNKRKLPSTVAIRMRGVLKRQF